MVASSLAGGFPSGAVHPCFGNAAGLAARIARLVYGRMITPIGQARAWMQRFGKPTLMVAELGSVCVFSSVRVFASSSSFSNL